MVKFDLIQIGEPFEVDSDASPTEAKTMFLQGGRYVAFENRKLSLHGRNYIIREQE